MVLRVWCFQRPVALVCQLSPLPGWPVTVPGAWRAETNTLPAMRRPPNWRNRAHAISVIYAVKNLMTHLDATGTLLSARGLMAMAVFDGLR